MSHSSSDRQTIAEGKYLRFVKRGRWEYVERTQVSGIVGVLAVTDDNKLILVEQYRPPLQNPVIELPAGLAGDTPGTAGEALAIAARRELLEETGYEASGMELLTNGVVS